MAYIELIKSFAECWLIHSPLEKNEYEMNDMFMESLRSFEENYNSRLNDVSSFQEDSDDYPEGLFVNRADFQSRADCFVEVHRGYAFAEEPIKHILPSAFKEFRRRYPDGVALRGVDMEFIKDLEIMGEELAFVQEPVVEPLSYTHDEWIRIFRDGHSISNGRGSVFINANPKGIHYGRLAIYTSDDEGSITVTQYQFDDWLEILITNASLLQSNRMDNSKDSGDRKSVVDYFSWWENRFDCDQYFESRAVAIQRVLLESVPELSPDIATMITDYIKYSALPPYTEVQWGTDKEYMIRAGATESMMDEHLDD